MLFNNSYLFIYFYRRDELLENQLQLEKQCEERENEIGRYKKKSHNVRMDSI